MELVRISDFSGPGQLWVQNPSGAKTPVLITHGTFSTAQTCAPLADFFAQAGHPTFVIEWRGRTGRPGHFDFHDLASGEISAALARLAEPAHLVAHSGGGLAMALALTLPMVRAKTRSLTCLGTQATHLHQAPLRTRLFMRLMSHVGRGLGFWPTRVLGLGPCNESSAILDHWLDFNAARRMTTRTGEDLFQHLGALDIPMLALAGAGDTVIAPQAGCRALAEAFGSKGRFHLCTAATDGEDVTHTRLLRSRTAARHVWPRITRFWSEHAAGD